ncbi:MAG: hypothetical protein EPN79_11165 [Burkholderiaceae bacterium]|nr:MAG: hypothetical protein EPN79_11165 [Burkholderiaceae bacterium]TBR76756.1 MAG: hypothetical protein EPN64_05910 [Burkholderiaceae bacterium]
MKQDSTAGRVLDGLTISTRTLDGPTASAYREQKGRVELDARDDYIDLLEQAVRTAITERRRLNILATFAHEVNIGAYSGDELMSAAAKALARTGMSTIESVLTLGTRPETTDAGACKWCGEHGPDFDETERPAHYCHHDN